MNKELSEALLDFYQKILAPDFASIHKKQVAHDGKFIDILGHFDDLYKHIEKLEEEYQMITFGMRTCRYISLLTTLFVKNRLLLLVTAYVPDSRYWLNYKTRKTRK